MEGEKEEVVTTHKTPHSSFQDCGERKKAKRKKKTAAELRATAAAS